MDRILEPELLDSLSPTDPAAIRSRRDLRRLNWWMRNEAHVANAIGALGHFPRSVLEVGAGDGTFMLSVARRLARNGCPPMQVSLLDMEPVVEASTLDAFRQLGWEPKVIRMNLRDWSASANEPNPELLLANLFLHHFEDTELNTFLEVFSQRCETFIACEPRRWTPAIISTRLLWCIGCNYVTRHDAYVSVRAGFRDKEISGIWPEGRRFQIRETPAGLTSHLFMASKATE